MNSDIQSLHAIANGYRNGRSKLRALRIKEIRGSDIREQLSSFNGLFEASIKTGLVRKPIPLSKAMRVFLAIDR